MKEFVEKLMSMLEKQIFSAELHNYEWEGQTVHNLLCLGDVKNVAEQLAEEYGKETNVPSKWIPCSERLPEESLNSVLGWDEYRERCCFVQYLGGRWVLGNDVESVKITAWMPVPDPYKPTKEVM